MKNFCIIIMIVASFLTFNNAMRIGAKSDGNYYTNVNERSEIDNDPRSSCPCPDNPLSSCPCDTIKSTRDNVEDSCSCAINDDSCNCILVQRRSRVDTNELDKNSNLFLQKLWNKVVNDVGESVTLYLLQKDD